jgi:predicted N-formylglutamate amidohydrolase
MRPLAQVRSSAYLFAMSDASKRMASPASAGEAFEIVEGPALAPFLLVCDHASNEIPAEYANLGLPAAELERHIAYDLGAASLTRALARRLDAPAVLSRFSRLVIDPNRGEDDPTLVMQLSDGAAIPGNTGADAAELERRLARFWRPYDAAIAAAIDRAIAAGNVPTLLSIHTFTPTWRGIPRPWHCAVLWDRDPRLAQPLLAALRAEGDLVVGDNEPYSGALKGDCMWRHGTSRGLAHAILDVRQDLVASEAGVADWVERLARILPGTLAQDRHPADETAAPRHLPPDDNRRAASTTLH